MNGFYKSIYNMMNYTIHRCKRLDSTDVFLVIYDDHRAILPVLWEARRTGVIDDLATLMIWDAHIDAAIVKNEIENASTKLAKDSTLQDAYCYASLSVGSNDGSWIIPAMEAGLVGEVVYSYRQHDISADKQEYEDSSGRLHRFYDIGSVRSSLEHQGSLVDVVCHEKHQTLWNALSWDAGKCSFTDNPNLVLDIDLDAFFFRGTHGKYVWREEMFVDEFAHRFPNAPSDHVPSVDFFLQMLLSKVRLITIAREPQMMHSQMEMHEIWSNINRYVLRHLSKCS